MILKKRLPIWLCLLIISGFGFTTVYADSNKKGYLQTWYEQYLLMDEMKTSQAGKLIDVINKKKEVAIEKHKGEIEKKHDRIRKDTNLRVQAYKQDYLSRLIEIEDILVERNFDDFSKRKTEEINVTVSQDVADYLTELLVEKDGSLKE